MKTPKYKGLRFKSTEDLFAWLKGKASKQIWFKDNGQDLQVIYIDPEGEILHSDMQSMIWTGKFVNVETLEVGMAIEMWDDKDQKWELMNRLEIETIILNKISEDK